MVISGMFILLFFGFSMVITVIGAVIFFMALYLQVVEDLGQ